MRGKTRVLFIVASVLSEAAALQTTRVAAIDSAAQKLTNEQQELSGNFASLRSFGAVRTLPLANRKELDVADLELLTGLDRQAFMANKQHTSALAPQSAAELDASNRAAFTEPSAQLLELVAAASLLLVVAALGLKVSAVDTLRELEHSRTTWLPVTCGVCSGSALSLMLVDALRRGGRLTRSLARPDRRDAIVRHEAGHFLACILLGVPVASAHIDSWRSLLGSAPSVTFQSPVLLSQAKGEACKREDIDKMSVIYMAGMAAEALHCGAADGGFADQGALRHLLAYDPSDEYVNPQQHARWATANAVLLLKAYPEAFEATCAALRARKSVGECCLALEQAFARHDLAQGGPRDEMLADGCSRA